MQDTVGEMHWDELSDDAKEAFIEFYALVKKEAKKKNASTYMVAVNHCPGKTYEKILMTKYQKAKPHVNICDDMCYTLFEGLKYDEFLSCPCYAYENAFDALESLIKDKVIK